MNSARSTPAYTACGRLIAAFGVVLAGLTAATAQVPLLEYKFNETGSVANDTGPLAHHAVFKDSEWNTVAIHGNEASGASKAPIDRTFDNNASLGMGANNAGGQLYCRDVPAFNGLTSITLQGWYYIPDSTALGNSARLFDKWTGSSAGFALRATGPQTLTLTINGTDVASVSHATFALKNKWVFFAVTVDATRESGNIVFYVGTDTAKATRIGDAYQFNVPLSGISYNSNVPLVIGNTTYNSADASPTTTRPWKGHLDNMRIYGSVGDHLGALTLAQVEAVRARDCADPVARVPIVEFLFNETGTNVLNSGTDAMPATMELPSSEGPVASNLHTGDKTGVSGIRGDTAFHSQASSMGSVSTGGRARQPQTTPALRATAAFTVTGWYRSSLGLTNAARILDCNSNTPNGFLVRANQGAAGSLVLTVNNQSAASDVAKYPGDDTWVFFAITYDAGMVTFYKGAQGTAAQLVNTAFLTGGMTGPMNTPTTALTVGNVAGTAFDRPFAGSLDNLRVFEGALTLSEIDYFRDLDASPNGAPPPAPVLEYRFSAGSTSKSTGTSDTDIVTRNTSGVASSSFCILDSIRRVPNDYCFRNSSTYGIGVAKHDANLAAIDNLKSFTLSGWYYATSSPIVESRLFDKHNGTNGYRLSLANGKFTLRIKDGIATTPTIAAADIPINQWVFYAVTYDGAQARFYTGTYFRPVTEVASILLAKGLTGSASTAPLALGNGSLVYDKPFLAYHDNFRLHADAVATDGALRRGQLEAIRRSDALEPGEPFSVTLSKPLGTYDYPADLNSIKVTVTGKGSGVTITSTLQDFAKNPDWFDSTTIPPSVGANGTFRHTIVPSTIVDPGYYQLTIEIKNSHGETIDILKRGVAVIPPGDTTFATSGNVFGAMVYPHIEYLLPDKERDVQFMKRIGLKWVRTHRLSWIHGEPNAPTRPAELSPWVHDYKWDDMDREVNLYDDAGINIIATTGWPAPKWATSAYGYGGHRSPTYFAIADQHTVHATAFYSAMAARFNGKVAYYEIGNEVDAYFWMGHLDNFKISDSNAIIDDYADTFDLVTSALRSGDAGVKFAPGTTSSMPQGSLHKGWLARILGLRTTKMARMNAHSFHYDVNIPEVQATWTTVTEGEEEMPEFIQTEIGGFWAGPTTSGEDPAFDIGMKALIKGDYHQMVNQLKHSPKALCKFLLREQGTYGGEGNLLAGLLDQDFNVRPSYVAYATLVRSLAGLAYQKKLNLSYGVTLPNAVLEAHAFSSLPVPTTVLFLHGVTGPVNVTLRSNSGAALKAIDVMGKTTDINMTYNTPLGKWVGVISMSAELPLIVKGSLAELPGEPPAAAPYVPFAVNIPVLNPGFDDTPPTDPNQQPYHPWGVLGGSPLPTVQRVTDVSASGGASIRLSKTTPDYTQYGGICQRFNIAANHALRTLQPDEYFSVKVRAKVRGANIDGMGLGIAVNIRKDDWTQLAHGDNANFGNNGSFGSPAWRQIEHEMVFGYWPTGANNFTLEFLLCYATGTLWIDDVEMAVTVHKRP